MGQVNYNISVSNSDGDVIEAPAGLPFLSSGGGQSAKQPKGPNTPPKASIVKGGKGGGAESGGAYDASDSGSGDF